MTTADPFARVPNAAELADAPPAEPVEGPAGRLLERIGEWMNPILVKECRQALKGKQFTVTFSLLLILSWLWSILGIAWEGPDSYYGFVGPDLFFGYFVILAIAVLVVVPYGAFHSLAAEREDNTFELVSITTLKPRQIIGGKLGSAVVQMLVYVSALSPCLAFTYLLRGIDMLTIVFLLGYVLLASLGLSLASLLLATVTREKHWQIVLSVLVVLALFVVFLFGCWWAAVMMSSSFFSLAKDPEFWLGHLTFLTAYGSYFALFYLAAAAQLTFASDNRSTPLRVVMLMQQVLFAGWLAWWGFYAGGQRVEEVAEFLMIFTAFSGVHWYLMGALMTGESPHLAPRVKRRLPQSFLGRALLTWFNPGPGTGYLFAVGNMLGALILTLICVAVWVQFNPLALNSAAGTPGHGSPLQAACFALLVACYVTIYLGLGKLIAAVFEHFISLGIFLTALIHLVLVFVGCTAPMVIDLMYLQNRTYTLLHLSNPFYTIMAAAERNTLPDEILMALTLLVPAAAVVFLLNLPSAAREVRHVRMAKPKRVMDEDTAAGLHAPPQAPPASPWD